jgi:putative toxin-antitoxin system antitoxin component (TIGR02293 family)
MNAEVPAVAEALGLKSRRMTAPMRLIDTIVGGLPVTSLDHLARTICPDDADFKHSFVPKATLSRRRKAHGLRLTAEESDRLARVAQVWAHAVEVWKGAPEARTFLFRPHGLLEDQRPIDVALSSAMGADLVDQILGRLAYGSAV